MARLLIRGKQDLPCSERLYFPRPLRAGLADLPGRKPIQMISQNASGLSFGRA
jgi:hypothetical protein